MDRAACRDMGPDAFFDDTEDTLALCAGCPVRHECLADALERPRDDDYGIRGGVTHATRRRLPAPVRRRLAVNLTRPAVSTVTVAATCLTCDGPLRLIDHQLIGPNEADALLVCPDGHETYLTLNLHEAKGA